MLADAVQANFPDGVRLPRGLQVLCYYVDAHGYPVSGCFEICERGTTEAAAWFPDDPEARSRLAIFGRGATGSSYALWLVPNPNPNEAPVVLLGSEGELLVLASNALQFCRLLGIGYTEVESDDLFAAPEEGAETAPLRRWLNDKLGLDFPAVGEGIVREAQDRHPDFASWMNALRPG